MGAPRYEKTAEKPLRKALSWVSGANRRVIFAVLSRL
jgi:hypothetical protein